MPGGCLKGAIRIFPASMAFHKDRPVTAYNNSFCKIVCLTNFAFSNLISLNIYLLIHLHTSIYPSHGIETAGKNRQGIR
jgi:hypothetical protein